MDFDIAMLHMMYLP